MKHLGELHNMTDHSWLDVVSFLLGSPTISMFDFVHVEVEEPHIRDPILSWAATTRWWIDPADLFHVDATEISQG
jgi:hypothetical protein